MAKFKLPNELKDILKEMFSKDLSEREANKMKREAKNFLIHNIAEAPKLMFVIVERFVELLIEDIYRDPEKYEMRQAKVLSNWSEMARQYQDDE